MATHYGLYDLGSNPGEDEIFRARPDRLQVPPYLLYNGYRFKPGRGDNHISASSTDVANGSQLYLRLPSVPAQACHGVNFILFIFIFRVPSRYCCFVFVITVYFLRVYGLLGLNN